MNGPERNRRAWFMVAMLLVALHGAFYVIAIPPWDLFDEEQHLDYVLTLRDERRIPDLEDTIRSELIASAVETDRWSTFRIGRPPSTEAEAMGLEGRSFEGYQPPLYYALLAPITLVAGDRALPALYLARSFGVLLLMVYAATAWALARRWFPRAGLWVPFGAALIAGGVSSAAEAAGRVNNDLLVATLISLAVLATVRLVDRPDASNGLAAGVIAAAAILAKSPGLLALGIVVVGLGLVWRRGRLEPTMAMLALAPGIVTMLLWTAFIYDRYGVYTGTSAFLELVVPFDPLPVGDFLVQVWLNAWSSYWGAYDGGVLRIMVGVLALVILALGTYGPFRLSKEAPLPYDGMLFTALLGAGLLAVLWIGNASGLVHPHGRIMLAIYPALAALVAGGWSRLYPGGALIPAMLAWSWALLSAGFWFLPFFYGSTS